MFEAEKKPSLTNSVLLVLLVLLIAFLVSCGGTLMLFVSTYDSGSFWIVPLFSTIVIASGPIGFCWMFIRKLGLKKGAGWIGLFVGAIALVWLAIFAGIMVEKEYLDYEFKHNFPALKTTLTALIGIAQFALIILSVVFITKRYAKYRGERLDELEKAKEMQIISLQE